LRFIPQQIFNR